MADAVQPLSEVKPKKQMSKGFAFAVGRRREAVARVRLYKEDLKEGVLWGEEQVQKGSIFINMLPIDKYFSGETAKAKYEEPLRVTNVLGKYIITVKVSGGGKSGQLDAFIHGVSRVLSKIDTERNRPILKKRGFLTRDARIRERRKIGTGGKARRQKQSPKR